MLEYGEILQTLNDEGVNYIVVGGIAVNLHGYTRFTADLDLLLALDHENLCRMDAVMKKLDFHPRQPVSMKDLENEEKIKELVVSKNFLAYTFFTSLHPLIHIDILTEESLLFKDYVKRKVTMAYENVKISVIDIDDLLKMKKKANRNKDALDIIELKKLKKV